MACAAWSSVMMKMMLGRFARCACAGVDMSVAAQNRLADNHFIASPQPSIDRLSAAVESCRNRA